jgi:hypothetical protein
VGTLLLSLADHRATRGPKLEPAGWRRHAEVTRQMLAACFSEPERAVAPRQLLAGDEVMAALGLPPGRLVGRILEAMREAQATGEVSTREEALALARQVARAAAE